MNKVDAATQTEGTIGIEEGALKQVALIALQGSDMYLFFLFVIRAL